MQRHRKNPATDRLKPRVCFLLDVDTFHPPFSGGIEQHAKNLLEAMTARGQELFVITRLGERARARSEVVGGISVRRIPPAGSQKGKGWRALLPTILLFIRLFYLLTLRWVRRYDIVVVSGINAFSIPALVSRLLTGRKCVLKVEVPTELPESVSRESLHRLGLSLTSYPVRLFSRSRNALLQKADAIIVISREIEQQLETLGVSRERIHRIPNGIQLQRFKPVSEGEKRALRERLGLPATAVIFVYAGRLVASKGLPLLLRVWAELVPSHHDLLLLLLGSGRGCHDDCEEELSAVARSPRLQGSIRFAGAVDNVPDYLQAADAFVFPSEYEALSLALLEALATGLPAVATRVGAAADLIRDRQSGVLVDPGDEPGLKMALEWLLARRDDWARMGGEARETVVRTYDIGVVAEAYMSLFFQLAAPTIP